MKEKFFIEDISYEGAGVAKVDGKVVFVPKTLVGEEVECLTIKSNSKFAIAKVENVLKSSDLRIEPRCPYFSICGGCDFEHCEYESELLLKKQILERELSKAVDIDEIEIVKSAQRFGYRNKIKLEVRGSKLGYFKAKSHDFFEVKECAIATKEINDALEKISGYLKEVELKNLKNVYIKQVDKNIGICFLFDKKVQKQHQNFKKSEKINDFSIFFAYGEILESDKTKVFCVQGNKKLCSQKGELKFFVDISAFNQINDGVADKLYDYVLSIVNQKRVINAYSGQGVLTAMLSSVSKFVYGIEFQVSAHNSAEKLCANLQNVENICGRVEDKISNILMKDRIDMIILDPAREGCQKSVLDAIISKKIKKIVYISCNFATLTRDMKILSQNFMVENIKIFDMFPCTANMETVAVLTLK